MTIDTWLAFAVDSLKSTGIGSANLDSQLLVADKIGRDRGWVVAHPEIKLSDKTVQELNAQLEERAKHVPLAYIRGKSEFYGREFVVSYDVLEPRPESETMIELALELAKKQNIKSMVDVGTGSGALAITMKLELPGTDVIATDIDPSCLGIAKKNAKKHNVNVDFLQGDLLEPLNTLGLSSYALLCNLPYVPDEYKINQAAMNEPKKAIFGGPDGLNLYRKLFKQSAELSKPPVYILTESLPPQHKQLTMVAARYGFLMTSEQDFIQVFESSQAE